MRKTLRLMNLGITRVRVWWFGEAWPQIKKDVCDTLKDVPANLKIRAWR